MSKKKQLKTSPKSTSRTARPSRPKTADEVRSLVRAGVTKDGAFAIAELASEETASNVTDWLSTQSLAIDAMLATPGLPCGRIVEVFGKNHSGKSTLAAHVAAECQRRGGVAYLVDQDNTADQDYYAALGVRTKELELIEAKARHFEAVVEGIERTLDLLVPTGILSVIIYDDIAAVETRHDLEQEFGKVQPGGMAKGIRGMCRRLLSKIARSKTLVLVTNQTYSKVGVVFGAPEVPFGGDGFGIFASVRLGLRSAGKLPNDAPGSMVKVRCVKSKVSKATHRETLVAIAHGRGFDNVYSIHELLSERRMIASVGRTSVVRLSEQEELRWVGGWQGLVNRCREEPEIYARLVDAYRALAAPEVPNATL